MGIFGDSKSDQIKYLDEERVKLWQRITSLESYAKQLEKEINAKTPEAEKEAKEHSRKAAEFRNKAEQRMEEAGILVDNLRKELGEASSLKLRIEAIGSGINVQKGAAEEAKVRVDNIEKTFLEKVVSLDKHIEGIDEVLEKYPDLEEELTKLDEFLEKIEENQKKSAQTLGAINSRKAEIDDIHREIFGYTDKDDAGDEITIEGLKDELEKAYTDLSERVSNGQKKTDSLSEEYSTKYKGFEEEHRKKYESINDEIRKLLPNALTAGLSSAFSTKRENEEAASRQLQSRFSMGIYMLIVVSVLPVIVSIVFLVQNIHLEEVINRLPRLVLAIVPMYIPLLWFTYSANKKLNLSKRLIEEYAHKEVLSRTYEGLSNQIAGIHDRDQSEQLRIQLLANFLQVSAENPGKLISNYEASDHPVMEALEQSYKFQIALDKLEGVPGLGKIAILLQKKANNKLREKKEKIEDGLSDEVGDDV